MRIGVIADIHCGPDRDVLPGSRSPKLLDQFIDAMRGLRPACIVDLGDRINSVTAGQDHVRERYVRRRLDDVGVPVYHVLGNTDVRRLAKNEALAVVGKQHPVEVVDLDGVRLVLLDTVDPAIENIGGAMGGAQIDWLRSVLTESGTPCLLFGHHPLNEPTVAGHHYFATRPDLACVRNGSEVRAVLEASAPAVVAFAGHLHWTRVVRVGRIPFLTVGSLVDTAYTQGDPCGAYALVSVNVDAVHVHVFGRASSDFTFSR